MLPSPSPSLHPSPSLPLLKISADRKAPPTPPPLLSANVHSLSLYLFLRLSAIISPPLFSPSRRIHPPPLLQSNPTAINQLLFSSRGRLVSAPSFLSLFTVYSIQPLHSLSTFISPPVTSSLSCSLPLVFLSGPQTLIYFFFYIDIKQIVYALACKLLIKMHYVSKHRTHSLL